MSNWCNNITNILKLSSHYSHFSPQFQTLSFEPIYDSNMYVYIHAYIYICANSHIHCNKPVELELCHLGVGSWPCARAAVGVG